MKANPLVSIVLVSTLWLTGSGAVNAQSGWPDAKKPVATTRAPSEKAARRAARPARKTASKKTPPIVETSHPRTVDESALRAMSEIIARQTLAIELLTRRVEAAERRLDVPSTTPPAPELPVPAVEESADLFRAALAVDWALVVDGLMP